MERLQKYMAQCGVASRRKCEELIVASKVKVNGVICSELGTKIDPLIDEVKVDDVVIHLEEHKVYIMLNKPLGYISSVKDEKGRNTIMDLVKVPERIYPIGRLDYDSSGLIIMTNDGEIYNKIVHPRKEIDKVYIAILDGIPNKEDIFKFCNGLSIEDYITSKAGFEIIDETNYLSKVRISIHEGKNRQIRKMCESIGHEVQELERIAIGNIQLNNLPSGQWRYLSQAEVQYLKSL